VTLNPILNRQARAADTTLVTDDELHSRLRRQLIEPMRPRALEAVREQLEARAVDRVDGLVGRGRFEAMSELASHLPVKVVAELVGLRGTERARMLAWSKATFNLIGAFNGRAMRALPTAFDMFRFQRGVTSEDVEPGSWIHRLFELRDKGELRHSEALGMVIEYLAPSLDTTIFATGNLLWRLARHPEQWEKLVANPGLVSGAVNESMRSRLRRGEHR
jgi:cytochrome P450